MHNEKKLLNLGLIIIIYNFCANLSNDIYLPSLPQLTAAYKTTPNIMQLTMTAWYAGVAVPQLFFGPLTDRFGRRPILYGGGLCFLVATLICALAQNVEVMIAARFLQGIGVCSWNVTSFAILADLYAVKMRTKVINKMGTIGTLAPLVGPIIGGYMLIYAGWRSNFIIIFILALTCLLGFFKTLPESNNFFNTEALYVKNIYKNYLLLIKETGFLRHLIPYCLLLSSIVAYLTAAPFIIITQLHVDPRYFGYTQLPIFGAHIIGAIILDRQKDETIMKKFLNFGLFIIIVASAMMFLLSNLLVDHLLIFVLPMTFFILGFSFCASPLISEVMSTQISSKGSASAFLGFGMAISCVISSSLVELLYNGSISSVAGLLFFLSFSAVCFHFYSGKRAELNTNQEQVN